MVVIIDWRSCAYQAAIFLVTEDLAFLYTETYVASSALFFSRFLILLQAMIAQHMSEMKIPLSSYRKLLLGTYFTLSILLFFFPEGNTRQALLAVIFASSISLFFTFPKTNNWVSVFLVAIFIAIFILIGIVFQQKYAHLSLYINFLSALYIAYALFLDRTQLPLVYNLFYFFLIILSALLITGSDANQIFPGSRNTVSMILVCVGSIFFILGYGKSKWHDAGLYSLIVICCILSTGRSGIYTSIILFSAWMYNYHRLRHYSQAIKVLTVLLSSVALIYYINVDTDYFAYLKHAGITDSYRWNMFNEYLSSLTIQSTLTGNDLSRLPYISSFNRNPHNSYILFHAHFGLPTILLYFIIIITMIRMFLSKNFTALLATLAACLRLATDSSTDITVLPLLIILIIFLGRIRWRRNTSLIPSIAR